MVTEHQYLDKYPISANSKTLILGTIHPHRTQEFMVPFFYGNRNSLWNLLSEAFPTELPKPITLPNIIHFLDDRKIAMSDTIKSCRRTNAGALDSDLIPIELNDDLPYQIQQSNIQNIFCTSSFGKNNAFKLFYENILGLKLTHKIRTDREILLPNKIFGRPVLLKALISPSGAANISLSKNPAYLAEFDKYIHYPAPVQAFKINYYKRLFSK